MFLIICLLKVVDISLPSREGKYPPLATDTEVNNCFSEIIELKNDDLKLIYSSQQLRFSRELLGGE